MRMARMRLSVFRQRRRFYTSAYRRVELSKLTYIFLGKDHDRLIVDLAYPLVLELVRRVSFLHVGVRLDSVAHCK
jgi:hypothetical protein